MAPKKPHATPAEAATFWAAVQRKAGLTGHTPKRGSGQTTSEAQRPEAPNDDHESRTA